jgi:ParB family chromosome partitioning protein
MTKKSGLGKGLDALIPGGEFTPVPGEQPQQAAGIEMVAVQAISPNPRQPRTKINPDELAELAASIRENGIIQPLIVTRAAQPGAYTLIAGERRLLAARQAGFELVPVMVREATDQQRLELALIENVQRADLSPLEAAEAYRQLAEDFNLTHEQIATRVGKSRAAVTNTLRLLKLPESIQTGLAQGLITEGHARALLTLGTPQAQMAAFQSVIHKDLSVRQAEELARKLAGQKPTTTPRPEPIPEVTALEDRLRQHLGTRVRLNPRKNGGTLVIHYYSAEELDALIEKLIGEQ